MHYEKMAALIYFIFKFQIFVPIQESILIKLKKKY